MKVETTVHLEATEVHDAVNAKLVHTTPQVHILKDPDGCIIVGTVVDRPYVQQACMDFVSEKQKVAAGASLKCELHFLAETVTATVTINGKK